MATIKDLKFDDKNFNKHTEYGMSLLEKSLRENGAGRSILLDKDNNIIAGNGVVETAGNIGLDDVQIVESDGSKIIAVKRTDISLNSQKGREMALADNATAKADIEWDEENLKSEFSDDEVKGWGIDLEKPMDSPTEKGELEFSEYIDEENNYILLKFDTDIDWINACSIFEIKNVQNYSTRVDGKITDRMRRIGTMRVINGAEALARIKNEH